MRLVPDEGVDLVIVKRLREDGHDVLYVAEGSSSIEDEAVLNKANESDALPMTCDKDFGELVFRQGRLHSGVVLLRLAGLASATKAALVAQTCRDHETELVRAFSVISHRQVRIRRAL